MALITKEMTIGDVVQKYPQLTETLLANGVHCVGCGARFFETLEMGFKGHGMTDAQVDGVIAQLNAAAEKAPSVDNNPVVLTELAAEKLKEILQSENKTGACLRMQVITDPDGGRQYGLDFEDAPKDNDVVQEQHGIRILVAPELVPLLRGARVDYADTAENPGFRIIPASSGGCGCH